MRSCWDRRPSMMQMQGCPRATNLIVLHSASKKEPRSFLPQTRGFHALPIVRNGTTRVVPWSECGFTCRENWLPHRCEGGASSRSHLCGVAHILKHKYTRACTKCSQICRTLKEVGPETPAGA